MFMNRTTVSLEPGILRRVKEEAARHGKTMQECLNEYLRIGMETCLRGKTKKKGWKLPTYSMGKPLVNFGDRHAVYDILRRP